MEINCQRQHNNKRIANGIIHVYSSTTFSPHQYRIIKPKHFVCTKAFRFGYSIFFVYFVAPFFLYTFHRHSRASENPFILGYENNLMKKIVLSVLISMSAVPAVSFAASFDCAKASSATEKLICGDETISRLDEQLAASYKAGLEKSTDKDAFKKSQMEWLKQQRACKSVECLKQVYQPRINELGEKGAASALAAQSSARSSKKPIRIITGGGLPLCNALYNLFAVQHKAKELSQSVEPLLAIKGVTLPEWKEIPYEEYFSIVNPGFPNDEKLKKFYNNFIKKYPNVKSYKTKINYDSEGADEYAIKMEVNDFSELHLPTFYILQDEHTLYKNYENTQYYQLFFYNGETYSMGASANSIGVLKPTRFDKETIIFSIPTICNIE